MTDLIDAWLAATHGMASPRLFRLWAGISMVSCAMSRRAWTVIEGDLPLYANTFVMLVGPPGVGKNRPLDLAKKLLGELPSVSFAGAENTREEMIRHMGEVFSDESLEGPKDPKAFIVMCGEIATFMPKPDVAWTQAMAELWNGSDVPYIRRTKNAGMDFVFNPYLCLMVGVQPGWFAEGFSPTSYELGFPARVYLIYGDKKPVREFFTGAKQATDLGPVREGLARVARTKGHIEWDLAAQEAWIKWMDAGQEPAVDDPLLQGYAARRDMHAAKLAMISAVAAGRPKITVADLERAWGWLFEAEADMPKALLAAGGNIFRIREENVVSFVLARYAATGKAVAEYYIRQKLGKMVPPNMVGPILDEMVAQKRLRVVSGVVPARLFAPPAAKVAS